MSHSGWSASNYISAVAGTVPTTYPYTIAIRVKIPSAGTGAGLGLFADSANHCWVGIVNVGVVRTQLWSEATTADGILGGTNLSTGTWYSIVGVFRSATDRQTYLNGVSDGTSTTSKNPSSFTTARAGLDGDGGKAFPGSLAEGAIWNVALSLSDIQALGIANASPLLVRPDALTTYLPLLDSGTIDLMAPAATVTGTLTKDNDHPRVILPRQRSLIIPNGAGGGGPSTIAGTAAQTLAAFTQSAAARLRLKGAVANSLAAFTNAGAGDLKLKGSASQTLASLTNASASKLRIKGTA